MTQSKYYPKFAELLNKYLDAEARSASSLARRLGVAPGTVNRWCSDATRPGSPETVIRIADILSIYDPKERQALLAAASYGYIDAGDTGRTGDVVAESAWASPPAVVVNIEPEVNIMRAGVAEVQAVSFGMPLKAGDRVMTFEKAAADIICQNGLLIRLFENRIWTVDCRSDETEAVELSPLLKVPWADAFQPTGFDTRPASRTPEMRDGRANMPFLLFPRNTFITDARPTFHWQPIKGASGYRLRVTMPGGKWWEAETSDSYLTYPDNVPALEPDYEHVVMLSTLDHPDKADETWLRMIDENKLAELEQAKLDLQALDISEAAKGYLLTQLYRQFELRSAAIRELEDLIKTSEDIEQANMPVSPDLWRQLGDLYVEIGLYMQAENSYQTVLDETLPEVEPNIQAQAYVGLARISVAFGDTQEAIEQLDNAETLYREAGDEERAKLMVVERRKLEAKS